MKRLLYVTLLCMLTTTGDALAQTREWTTEEQELKAIMLVNFLRFANFSIESNTEVMICVVGRNVFGQSLNFVEGKKIKRRTIKIVHLPELSEKALTCNMIFFTNRYANRRSLSFVEDLPIITVAETTNFARLGGLINLVNVGTSVRFRINYQAARRRSIQFSSTLLRLATIVKTSSEDKNP